MLNIKTLASGLLAATLLASCGPKAPQDSAQLWVTSPADNQLFTQQSLPELLQASADTASHPFITVDSTQRFQEIDGFGYTLTGGSAYVMMKMSPLARKALLQELFGTEGQQIGISYLRIAIAASDLDFAPYSFNELPAGVSEDFALKHFSMKRFQDEMLPLIKEILAVNPSIKFMAVPWSPPVWMKTNKDYRGGQLRPDCYDVYADYLCRYLQEMQKAGVAVDAMAIQNEPLHPGNNPSLLMLAAEQALFVKKHLGPKLRQAGLQTKVVVYDHNADRPDYPIEILNDKEAREYVDGSAFHLYGGTIDALSKVHEAHPDKNIYFTEQWIGAPGNLAGDLRWHVRELIIGATRHWSRTVLEWNLAADAKQEPHTDRGGCVGCLGAVTVEGDSVVRNPAYYIIAHASKHVRPGSVRVHSDMPAGLPNVAFVNPEGKVVQVVLNDTQQQQTLGLRLGGQQRQLTLNAGAVATVVW